MVVDGLFESVLLFGGYIGEFRSQHSAFRFYISEGDEIIVSGLEHHSNIVPWQMLCGRKKAVLKVIPLREDLSLDIEAFKGLLNEKTKLVSVAHVSNVLGTIQPVEEIIRLAHERGVPVCIDGAQSVPHMKVDIQTLDCDFLVFSGHKMYGPTGIGVLYGKKEWLDKLPPHEGGGEMIEHVRWEGTTYNELPYKFEAGTPNFVGSYALHRALDYILETGWEAIEAHERELTEYCEEQLVGVGCRVYGAGQPKAGVISFNVFSHQPSVFVEFCLRIAKNGADHHDQPRASFSLMIRNYFTTLVMTLLPSVISLTTMFTPWNGVALSIPWRV